MNLANIIYLPFMLSMEVPLRTLETYTHMKRSFYLYHFLLLLMNVKLWWNLDFMHKNAECMFLPINLYDTNRIIRYDAFVFRYAVCIEYSFRN